MGLGRSGITPSRHERLATETPSPGEYGGSNHHHSEELHGLDPSAINLARGGQGHGRTCTGTSAHSDSPVGRNHGRASSCSARPAAASPIRLPGRLHDVIMRQAAAAVKAHNKLARHARQSVWSTSPQRCRYGIRRRSWFSPQPSLPFTPQ